MYDHIGLKVKDLAASRAFYAAVLKPLGFVALLGVLALVGMIARNSVILIDQIEHERAQGRDAWEGTLGELLGDHLEGSDRERLWRLEENLIDRGVITEDEDGNQGFEIADVAHLLTYDDISDLLDDPNVVISVEGHRP